MKSMGKSSCLAGAVLVILALAVPCRCQTILHEAQRQQLDPAASCQAAPKCCRDHVYLFLVNGLDPVNYGDLTGLRDYLHKLGFNNTYYGQFFHGHAFRKEIYRIHDRDPQARFVLIGFSIGANVVHSLAESVQDHAVTIALMVYLSGNNPVTPMPAKRPENVECFLNVLACGIMKNRGERGDAENLRVPNTRHFDIPMHPTTQRALAEKLAMLVASVPVTPQRAPGKATLFDGEPTPRPVRTRASYRQTGWDFLKPATGPTLPQETGPQDGSLARNPALDLHAAR